MSDAIDNKSEAASTGANVSPPAVQATLTINSASIVNLFCACFGAGLVFVGFKVLLYVGALFGGVLPFIGGGILFATMLSGFFFLLRTQKAIRRSARFRVTQTEAYAAASVFVSMGFFAIACLHAFKADGMAASSWSNGVASCAFSLFLFGAGKAAVWLWDEGKKAR